MAACGLWLLLSSFAVSEDAALTNDHLGRIEGTCFNGKTPCVDQEMALEPKVDRDGQRGISFVKTDAKGYFVYDNLEPGFYTVGRFDSFRVISGGSSMSFRGSNYIQHVKVEPGQTVTVKIGGVGRKVTGKLIAPEGTAISLGWQGSHDRSLASSFKWPLPPDELSVAEAAAWYEEYKKSEQYQDRYRNSFFCNAHC